MGSPCGMTIETALKTLKSKKALALRRCFLFAASLCKR